jgi:hypothetical protein
VNAAGAIMDETSKLPITFGLLFVDPPDAPLHDWPRNRIYIPCPLCEDGDECPADQQRWWQETSSACR